MNIDPFNKLKCTLSARLPGSQKRFPITVTVAKIIENNNIVLRQYKARLLFNPNKVTEVQLIDGTKIRFPGQEHMAGANDITIVSPNPYQNYPARISIDTKAKEIMQEIHDLENQLLEQEHEQKELRELNTNLLTEKQRLLEQARTAQPQTDAEPDTEPEASPEILQNQQELEENQAILSTTNQQIKHTKNKITQAQKRLEKEGNQINITPIDTDWITYAWDQVVTSNDLWKSRTSAWEKYGGIISLGLVGILLILLLSVGMEQYFKLTAENSGLQIKVMEFSKLVMGYVNESAMNFTGLGVENAPIKW
jgi:hypothetical protein